MKKEANMKKNEIINISTKTIFSDLYSTNPQSQPRIEDAFSRTDLSAKKEEITKKLKLHLGFTGELNDQQKDVIDICFFLMDQQKVLQYLAILNEELVEKAKELKVYDETTKGLKGYQARKPFKHNRFLSNFLMEWALAQGFAGIATIRGFLTEPGEFPNIIKKRFLIKDAALGKTEKGHGEYSHELAWWLIGKAVKLRTPIADLYQWIGEQPVQVWFNLFEIPMLEIPNDMRNVFNFNKAISSDYAEKNLTVLYQLIKGRMCRRDEKQMPEDDTTVFRTSLAESKTTLYAELFKTNQINSSYFLGEKNKINLYTNIDEYLNSKYHSYKDYLKQDFSNAELINKARKNLTPLNNKREENSNPQTDEKNLTTINNNNTPN